MTDEGEPFVHEMDAYPAKNFRIDMAHSKAGVILTIKTWGQTFTNRPVALLLTKEVAADLLRRLEKATNGVV